MTNTPQRKRFVKVQDIEEIVDKHGKRPVLKQDIYAFTILENEIQLSCVGTKGEEYQQFKFSGRESNIAYAQRVGILYKEVASEEGDVDTNLLLGRYIGEFRQGQRRVAEMMSQRARAPIEGKSETPVYAQGFRIRKA